MPETPDWAAAPQALALTVRYNFFATPGGVVQSSGVAVVGRKLVLVAASIGADLTLGGVYQLRSAIHVQLQDQPAGSALTQLAISPEHPADRVTPPFGSLQALTSQEFGIVGWSTAGSGTQGYEIILHYLYE